MLGSWFQQNFAEVGSLYCGTTSGYCVGMSSLAASQCSIVKLQRSRLIESDLYGHSLCEVKVRSHK